MSKWIKWLSLGAVLVLALSGCKMVAVDTAKDDATVVAEYKGGTILKGDAMKEYDGVVTMYREYGYGDALDDAAFVTDLKKQVLDYMINERILGQKAKEFGTDAIPEDKRQELTASASKQYQDLVAMYRASFEQEGMTDEEAIAATKAGLEAQMGVSEQIMVNYELSDYQNQMLVEAVTKDVATSDEDLKAAYDEKVAQDQQTYTDDPGAYESAVTYGDAPMWAPEGVRTVKHILIRADEALMDEQADVEDRIAAVELAIEDKTAPAGDLDLAAEDGDAEPAEPEGAVGGATVDNTGAEPVVSEPEAAPEPEVTAEPEVAAEPAAAPAEPATPADEPAADDAEALPDELAVDAADPDAIVADDEDYDAMTLDELNAKKAELGLQLDGIKARVRAALEPKVAEVQAKIDAGEDFDALIEQYGEDPGMKSDPAKSEGYPVSAISTMWDPAFKDGAMALEKVGDVSGPVYGQNGCHFIRYFKDVPAGAADFESVKEGLRASTLEAKKGEAYDAAVQQWTEEAEVKLYPERM